MNTANELKLYVPDANCSKQAASLLALSGAVPAEKAKADVIAKWDCENFSTFYCYCMLQAKDYTGH